MAIEQGAQYRNPAGATVKVLAVDHAAATVTISIGGKTGTGPLAAIEDLITQKVLTKVIGDQALFQAIGFSPGYHRRKHENLPPDEECFRSNR